MKTRKTTSIESVMILCVRRFVLVLTTVFLNRYIIVNFFVYFYGSLWLLNYYISKKPFEWIWAFKFELLNEGFVLICSYFVICFSEYISNIQIRYQVGNLFIDMIVVVVILNQFGIFYEMSKAVFRYKRRQVYQKKWKLHLMY